MSTNLGAAPKDSQSQPEFPKNELPETDLEFFEPRPAWSVVNLRELWKFRGLFWVLGLRDVTVRYRQTVVGIAWAVLQPLITGFLFVFMFGLLGRVPTSGEIPYGLFVLSGVVLWQLFAGTVSLATGSLVANQNLIGKIYFPRLILPLATVIPGLIDFAVGMVLVSGVLAYYGLAPSLNVVFLPGFVLLALLSALAVGIWTSALNAIYRDIGTLLPFLIQVGFFVSPVVYSTVVLIPEAWRPLLALNPMVGALEGFRWAILGRSEFPLWTLLSSLLVVSVTLLTGLLYFRRVEGFLADRI